MRTYYLIVMLLLGVVVPASPSFASPVIEEALIAYEKQDYAKAKELWSIGANRGDAQAQYNLGVMYANGRGVPQNYKEAARWYRLAAEQGNAEAQTRLGVMCDIGQGVPRNDKEALKWYRLAAEQSHATAQLYLGDMYFKGEGVKKNLTVACAWWAAAAANGNRTALHNLDMAIKKMTPSQVEEAQMLVKEYLARAGN